MRTIRRLFVLAVLVGVVVVLRDRLLAADEARTGYGAGAPRRS